MVVPKAAVKSFPNSSVWETFQMYGIIPSLTAKSPDGFSRKPEEEGNNKMVSTARKLGDVD